MRFKTGDTIIIDEEGECAHGRGSSVNSQWFRGRVIPQGEQFPRDFCGLFPSNYIQKGDAPLKAMVPLQSPPPPTIYQPPPPEDRHGRFGKLGEQVGRTTSPLT